ncbi:RHS repeat-associated core domain-containing protein, partial [Weeksellaceae bacterium A-14]
YMPDIGRWGVVDPLAEKRPNMSPYVFCSNNPINRIDPDGRFDSKFGAFMHKLFHGHLGSKTQQNTNANSKNNGQYYYSYDSSTKSGSTTSTENGQKTTNIAEVSMTTVYNRKQEQRTIAALRNTAEKLDYVAVAADVTAIALGPETLGTGTVAAEAVSVSAGAYSTVLNSYADALQGHYKTAAGRIILYGVSFGIGKKIESWKNVIGDVNTRILQGHKVIYDKVGEKAVEESDNRNYKKINPEDL